MPLTLIANQHMGNVSTILTKNKINASYIFQIHGKRKREERVREISKDGGKIFYKNSVLNDLVRHVIPFG